MSIGTQANCCNAVFSCCCHNNMPLARYRPARTLRRSTSHRSCRPLVRRGVRAGLYPADVLAPSQLVEDYDNTLFAYLMNFEQHVLHKRLSSRSYPDYNLRSRPYNLSLCYAMDHRNFIPRLAFENTYRNLYLFP